VRRSGNRIRVTAQLIAAADGNHIWSERYDREMTDVFAIQDEISQAITEKLQIRLARSRPIIMRRSGNIEAYNLYLIGRHHFVKLTPEGAAKGKEYFEKAIELDPNCALAWFGLANFYHYLGGIGLMPSKQANALCRQATLKALNLDQMLPQAHAMMAVLQANDFEWHAAELGFRRALELGPKSVEAIGFYCSFYLVPLRRLDEAVEKKGRLILAYHLPPGCFRSRSPDHGKRVCPLLYPAFAWCGHRRGLRVPPFSQLLENRQTRPEGFPADRSGNYSDCAPVCVCETNRPVAFFGAIHVPRLCQGCHRCACNRKSGCSKKRSGRLCLRMGPVKRDLFPGAPAALQPLVL